MVRSLSKSKLKMPKFARRRLDASRFILNFSSGFKRRPGGARKRPVDQPMIKKTKIEMPMYADDTPNQVCPFSNLHV